MQMQAENLRIYSLAYEQFKNPAYLKAALDIHRYLRRSCCRLTARSIPVRMPI